MRSAAVSGTLRGIRTAMQQILAAIDFSVGSQAVVDLAADLARSFSAKLWLVHVAAPDPEFVGYAPGPQTVRDQRAAELRSEHRELQERAARLCEQGIEAEARIMQGPTVETILQEASRHSVDLIVVGSHGHGVIHRALLGSVSEGILRHSSCPVLVMP